MREKKQTEITKTTRTGLPAKLPSNFRSVKLKELAIQRGQRLRTIRNLAKLSLEEFAEKLGAHPGQLGRQERGDSCMGFHHANVHCRKLLTMGILVRPEWLLTGAKEGPKFIAQESFSIYEYLMEKLENKKKDPALSQESDSETEKDNEEKSQMIGSYLLLKLFQETHSNSELLYVNDNKMHPVVTKGDVVAGVKVAIDNPNLYHDKICILQLQDTSVKIVRKINVIENMDDLVILSTMDGSVAEVVKTPQMIAPIIFRYHDVTNFEFNVKVETNDQDMLKISFEDYLKNFKFVE